MQVFPLSPDWSSGISETTEYLTDVLVAYSDAEQRRGLRANPRRGLSFSVVAMSASESSLLESVLFASLLDALVLPWWPDATRLQVNAAAGALELAIDTTSRLFAPGGTVVLWRSSFDYEVATVSTVASDSISLAAPTTLAAPAIATIVLPAFQVRIANDVELSRYSSIGIGASLAFAGLPGQIAPEFASTPTQYRGLDVLDVAPNWGEEMRRTIARSLIVLDSGTGDLTIEPKSVSPISTVPFTWFLPNRGAVADFRAFVSRRKGKLVPFWMPSFDANLSLVADVLSTATTIRIASSAGYTSRLFPFPSRRDLAFLTANGIAAIARVQASVDNHDGTETLTLTAAIGTAIQAARTQVSLLELVRLTDDATEISWISAEVAAASTNTVEVPREIP